MTAIHVAITDVAMDKSAIMGFCGLYLQKYKHITAQALQKFIIERDEVGKAISIDDIEESLSMLYCGYFISIVHNSESGTVYERNTN
jgi:hypothetical protein